jgi:hypothetical protein
VNVTGGRIAEFWAKPEQHTASLPKRQITRKVDLNESGIGTLQDDMLAPLKSDLLRASMVNHRL